jgi:hypothetical protein
MKNNKTPIIIKQYPLGYNLPVGANRVSWLLRKTLWQLFNEHDAAEEKMRLANKHDMAEICKREKEVVSNIISLLDPITQIVTENPDEWLTYDRAGNYRELLDKVIAKREEITEARRLRAKKKFYSSESYSEEESK